MDYRGIVSDAERRYGLQPGLLASVWKQESDESTDLGLKGPQLSRGRGTAVGPFQIVPYYHPGADFGSFEMQADYAARYLKEVGVEGYYGTGQAPAGQPTPAQYQQQVMSRLPGGGQAQAQPQPQEPQMQNYQNPVTASAVQGVMQPQQTQESSMFNSPLFWIQAAAGMGGGGGNPMAGIAQGFGQAATAYQARNQMTPYERAKIDAMRDEAAMRQGISPLEQAKLAQRKAEFSAQQQSAEELRGREQAAAEVARRRQMEADWREQDKYQYEVENRGKGSVPGGAVREGDKIMYLPGSNKDLEMRESMQTTANVIDNVKLLQSQIEEHGTEMWNREVAGRMSNLYGDIQTGIRLAQEMGAPQAAELTILAEQLPDPTSLGAQASPGFKSKAKGAYDELVRRLDKTLGQQGTLYKSTVKDGSLDFLGRDSNTRNPAGQDGWGEMMVNEPGGA